MVLLVEEEEEVEAVVASDIDRSVVVAAYVVKVGCGIKVLIFERRLDNLEIMALVLTRTDCSSKHHI